MTGPFSDAHGGFDDGFDDGPGERDDESSVEATARIVDA